MSFGGKLMGLANKSKFDDKSTSTLESRPGTIVDKEGVAPEASFLDTNVTNPPAPGFSKTVSIKI